MKRQLSLALALALSGSVSTPGSAALQEGHEPKVRKPPPSPEKIAALPPDGGDEFNRLVFEKSPYLLQHARNPVDWFAWGEEAFAEAKRLDRPVFLSVGYSTCHWCHVMEHESFEDPAVAKLMNEAFICIKVDREERPEIDQVYMNVTQALNGRGGWPMTVVMTPAAEPFFAATYIPKESRRNMMGMLDLVPRIDEVWKNDREKVTTDVEKVLAYVRGNEPGAPGEVLGAETLSVARRQQVSSFDHQYAGFGRKPKFPIPHNLLFLLQQAARHDDRQTTDMVEQTLAAMRRGGIYDHVGYGFHRYSTDEKWLLPHFEKMLYDQALLAMAYTAAWQITGDGAYRRTADEIFTYVLRDMTSPEGGFYSAEDADSEGEEGLFYVWTQREIIDVLGEDEAQVFTRVFGVTEEGNFADEATRRATGRNILHLGAPLDQTALELGMPLADLDRRLEASRAKLFVLREKRIHPLKDDKVLTDWNGLMIAALARAAAAYGEERYALAARRAADFVLAKLRTEDGRLLKRYRDSEAAQPATLEDYSFLVWGLLDLYEATFDVRYLKEALALVDTTIAHYHDAENGGFFLGADDGEQLFVRVKDVYDGAIPSGNSVMALNLLRVSRFTGKTEYEKLADGTLRAFSPRVAANPGAYTQFLAAVDFAVGPSYEIVVAGDPEAEDTRAMLRAIQGRFLPHKVLVLRPDGDAPPITAVAEYTKPQSSIEGKATAYVCQSFACDAPTSDLAAVMRALEHTKPSLAPPDSAGD